MVSVSLKDFAVTGAIGPVTLGYGREALEVALGEPEATGGETRKHRRPNIWKYGDVEFFFDRACGELDMIHIDRSKRAEAWANVAEQGRRYMAQGNWVIMFPEGTRTPRGGQGVYKVGGTRLAVETGRPVVPIAVTSARCWPRKSFLLRPGVVDIYVTSQAASSGGFFGGGTQQTQQGEGAGVVYNSNGYIITDEHVQIIRMLGRLLDQVSRTATR